jgi:hypothetical protein
LRALDGAAEDLHRAGPETDAQAYRLEEVGQQLEGVAVELATLDGA